jgi:hypothetical protein
LTGFYRNLLFFNVQTDSGIKKLPLPVALANAYIAPTFWDQTILIPQLWPSRQFDPRIVGIKPLDPQGNGIKSGLRVNLIPQCWGSNHSDPAAVAFASI